MGDGRRETNIDRDGFVKDGYDHASTKDVSESSGGQHSTDDKGETEETNE